MLDTDRFEEVGTCDAQLMSDGYVIYQEDAEKVHYLNPSASTVFELARGGITVGEIGAYLQETHQLPQPPKDEVMTCLKDLIEKGLIKPCS